MKGDIDIEVDIEVEVGIDRYFGCFKGVSKSVQGLSNDIEVIVLTSTILK